MNYGDGVKENTPEIDESQSGFVVMEQLLLEFTHIGSFSIRRVREKSAWAKFEIDVWCCHGHCMTSQYGDTLATAAGRVRTHFAANPSLRTRFGISCGRIPEDDQ